MKLFLTTFFLLFSTVLWAQNDVKNPHGNIKWDCISCHTTDSWSKMKQPLDFKHEETGFPLAGGHQFTECMSCHETPKFTQVGAACADCHTDVHKGEFGINCQTCHTPHSWESQQDMLDVHAGRGFPLSGAHATIDCQSCHISEQRNEFAGLSSACFSCHTGDFAITDDPNHAKAGFAMDCESCHQPTAISWQENVRFEHPPVFELRGAHISLDCANCHAEQFAGTPSACYSCHAADYQQTRFPDHQAAGFPMNCETCHTETQWQGAEFDHLAASGFELRGAHVDLQCLSCHVSNQFAGIPRDCYSCHESDYAATTAPNHAVSGFPTDCMICHTETAWQPAAFDHNQTNFPLTGQHAAIECVDCHTDNQFLALPTDCFSCHQSDFENVTDPNHVANNFDHNCMTCHTTSGWSPASFDHNNTGFPLTGAHVPLECIACHDQGFVNTPIDCFSCHQTDYQNTTDPNHQSAGFPTDCVQCHSTSNWDNANWDHDGQYFPIYSGKHKDEWAACVDCHVNSSNFMVFECIFCHEHNQSDMDKDHSEVAGYVYESNACYTCHPNGKSDIMLERMGK